MNQMHTDQQYESELRKLRHRVLLMGAKVERMIGGSIRAHQERDSDLARDLIAYDEQVDRLEIETDDRCLRILARRQPVASDLRLVTMTLKLVTDLERIGDLGVNICERVVELNEHPPLRVDLQLGEMGQAACAMLRDALDAFVSGDAEAARAVIRDDSVVDAHYARILEQLLSIMTEEREAVYRATRLQSIAKYLERVGDHSTNLAEMVVFMVNGRDIRHKDRSAP